MMCQPLINLQQHLLCRIYLTGTPGNLYQHHGSKHAPTCKLLQTHFINMLLQTCHGSAGRHKQHSYMMSKRNCTEVLYLALLILVLAAGLLSKQSTLQAWR